MKTLSEKELKKLKIDKEHCEEVACEMDDFINMINDKYEKDIIHIDPKSKARHINLKNTKADK